MPTLDEDVIVGLFTELAKEESALAETDAVFRQARIKFDVASHKYAAVRDMVTEQLGFSPYLTEDATGPWPYETEQPELNGFYRFILMKPGDAIVAALKEMNEPLTLQQIQNRLINGRFPYPTRAINAALMRTKGVVKTDDDKYIYQEPEPEEVPF